MKTVLVLAAALGLSASATAACPYHDISAQASQTDSMTVASVAADKAPMSTPADAGKSGPAKPSATTDTIKPDAKH